MIVISEFEGQGGQEKTLAQDIPYLRKEGTIIYADINTTRTLIEGSFSHMGFFTNITKRKNGG